MSKVFSDSTLKISLKNLVSNYRYLSSLSHRQASAVVKANAYGLGVEAVATALYQECNCKFFFVATLDEAIKLRGILPQTDAKIAVFNGIRKGQAEAFHQYNIIPVLNHLEEVKMYSHSVNLPPSPPHKGGGIMMHFDTGMNRLGITKQDFEKAEFWYRLKEVSHNLEFEYALTHLATADDETNSYNEEQASNIALLKRLAKEHLPDIKFSIANSAGTLVNNKALSSELNRLGCGLYGINPLSDKPLDNHLKPVAFITSKIIALKSLPKDSAVGYGASFITKRESIIATIPIGYADFYPRNITNAEVIIRGVRAKIIGKISMDMITVDATEIEGVQLNDEVEIMGCNISVNEIADKSSTIGYEILTRLGRRFRIVYN